MDRADAPFGVGPQRGDAVHLLEHFAFFEANVGVFNQVRLSSSPDRTMQECMGARSNIHDLAHREYETGCSGAGPVDARWAALTSARKRFESIDDVRCAAWCALDLGIVSGTERGDLDEADAWFQRAYAELRGCEDWRGVGHAVAKLSNLATVRGDIALARRHLESFEAHVRLIDGVAAAGLADSWADVLQAEGRWAEAVEQLKCALASYERAGSHHEILGARVNLGRALVACGQLDEATTQADLAEQSSPMARAIDRPRLGRLRASISLARGRAIEGSERLHEALAADDLVPFDELGIRLDYGEQALRAGNLDAAERELRRSVDLARTLTVPATLLRALDSLRSCLIQSGDVQAAFAAALECFELDAATQGGRVTRRIERCANAVSLARQIDDEAQTRRLVHTLVNLLSAVEDTAQVLHPIQVAIDGLHAAGDELGARRLQSLIP